MKLLNSNKEVKKYGVVIPCYNEEQRLPYHRFLQFAKKHPEVILCFVNDGSRDRTLSLLRGLQYESPENISVYSLAKNSGKSEAVRQGMLFVERNYACELIGFLDADLATLPEEWLQMAKYKENYSEYGAIVGSRIQRLGAKIKRDDNRSFFSLIIKMILRVLLKAKFQDTQCGAKVFHRGLVPHLFSTPFLTPWLFDVEIFLRLQKKFGKSTLQNGILEFPLLQWNEIEGSKIRLKDTLRIPMQILRLFFTYRMPAFLQLQNERQ
jgi:glycosyltransferase involved in cell wall biosynthesis